MAEQMAHKMKVKLKGRTKKGKQRVQQHGPWWLVVSMGSPACCNHEPALMLKPERVHPTSDVRWVLSFGDPDFEILEQVGILTIEI